MGSTEGMWGSPRGPRYTYNYELLDLLQQVIQKRLRGEWNNTAIFPPRKSEIHKIYLLLNRRWLNRTGFVSFGLFGGKMALFDLGAEISKPLNNDSRSGFRFWFGYGLDYHNRFWGFRFGFQFLGFVPVYSFKKFDKFWIFFCEKNFY